MNRAHILLAETLCGAGLFGVSYFALKHRLGGTAARPYRMDPIQPQPPLPEVVGGFEPHLKRYQNLAQHVLTLATATVAFLVNFLTGIPVDGKRNAYSLRLESACPSAVVFLGLGAIFAIIFILRYNTTYERYCHAPLRNTYTAASYAANLALGYSAFGWFVFAYVFLAYRLLT